MTVSAEGPHSDHTSDHAAPQTYGIKGTICDKQTNRDTTTRLVRNTPNYLHILRAEEGASRYEIKGEGPEPPVRRCALGREHRPGSRARRSAHRALGIQTRKVIILQEEKQAQPLLQQPFAV